MLRRRRQADTPQPDTPPVIDQIEQPEREVPDTAIYLGRHLIELLSTRLSETRISLCGDLTEYGDRSRFDALMDRVDVPIDSGQLWDAVTDTLKHEARAYTETEVRRNNAMLTQRGKVAIANPESDEIELVTVPKTEQSLFADIITESADAVVTAIDTAAQDSPELIETMVYESCATYEQQIDKYIAATPTMDSDISLAAAATRGLAPEWIEAVITDRRHQFRVVGLRCSHEHPGFKRAGREARKLFAELEAYADDPLGYATERLVESLREDFAQFAEKTFQEHLVAANTAQYGRLHKVDTKERRAARREERAPAEQTLGVVATPRVVEPKQPHREGEASMCPDEHFELKEQRTFTERLSLPWVRGGEPKDYKVSEVSYGDRRMYVVEAMDPKLKKVARKVRAKQGPSSKAEFDAAARLLAYRVALEDSNGAAGYRILSNHRSEQYECLPVIFYNPEIANNAKRVYVAKSDSIEPYTDGDTHTIQSDVPVVFVIGEADKQSQLEVLGRITGLERHVLIDQGAGAV